MLNLRRCFLSTMILIAIVVLSACGGDSKESGGKTPAPTPEQPKEISGKIDVWGANSLITEMFNKKFPNVTVEDTAPKEHVDAVVIALAGGTGAPDVARVWEAHLLKFGAVEGLENLLGAPYNAGQYERDFMPVTWNYSQSMDGKKLIALPIFYSPYVMLYRNDIFEENGFPSDPEDVGVFVSDPDNFFDMAMKLRQKGHQMFRNISEVTNLGAPDTSYFDRSLNFIRKGEEYVKAIDYAKRAAQLDLVFTGSKEETDQALNSGKLATYFNHSASFGSFYQEGGNKSDNMGNWRLTNAPFGYNKGWGFDVYVLPSQSKNKEAAWEYMKFTAMAEDATTINAEQIRVPAYMPAWDLPEVQEAEIAGFGNQRAVAKAIEISRVSSMGYRTPLYLEAQTLWGNTLAEGLGRNQDSRALLAQLEETIEKALAGQKAEILKAIGK